MAQTSGKRLAGWLAVSLSAHVLLFTLPVAGLPVRPPVFSFLHARLDTATPAPTAPSAKPAGKPAPLAPARPQPARSVPPEPKITPPPPANLAPAPAALDIPDVMPAFGPTARRGWRQAPPSNAMTSEYWRQRQAMLLAEAENRRLDHENRQRAELERSIGETLAAAGRPIDDGECSLSDEGEQIRCSSPDLQAAIKGQEAALIGLHQATAKADQAGAVELLQVRDGRLRLPHRR